MERIRNFKGIQMILALSALMILLVGCATTTTAPEKEVVILEKPYERQEFLMGTYVVVRIFDEDKEYVLDKAFDRIEELEDKLSVNSEGSEVARINQVVGKSSVKVSDDVYPLIESAHEYSERPDDGFDYTIGPIVNLWRIGYDDARLPSQDEIDAALSLVDHEAVELNKKEQSVYLKNPGMSMDLGAIAKGYITDEAIKVLEKEGVTTGIVDLGGNVVMRGDSPTREEGGWNVGIQNPFLGRGQIAGFTNQKDKSVVTSGVYERYLEVDGKQYHHLLSPETGYPFENDIAGVTIISELSIDGDALSTGVFSLGLEEGLDYVNSLDGIEAVFITKDKDLYTSEGLTDNFTLSNDEFIWVNE